MLPLLTGAVVFVVGISAWKLKQFYTNRKAKYLLTAHLLTVIVWIVALIETDVILLTLISSLPYIIFFLIGLSKIGDK